MRITIHGHDLPGRRWDCQEGPYENVHVGLQVGSTPAEPVPGDAPSATWALDVRVLTGPDGALDVRGPGVHGRPGERFVYLTWGDVAGEDGSFAMFRRAKLMWADIDPDLVPRRRPAAGACGPTSASPTSAAVHAAPGCGPRRSVGAPPERVEDRLSAC